ncbi:MAG: acetoin utilization protein AcuC [Candidatus Limnocylindrales bacterium]
MGALARGRAGRALSSSQGPRDGPLVVYGERSLEYDFGPLHPLTPRRFPPAIDLLRALGATGFLAPEPATRAELERLHLPAYIDAVERFSIDPALPPARGIGPGDCPAFAGMHDASAAVAGGSLEAMRRILQGELEHAFHPGGGLHHAMAGRASGFCIYNDVALAVALARDAGHRVLYVDLDVHHGDGVEALFWDDPEVVTCSFHESGLTLFPGSGFVEERGAPEARGTAVNVPFQAGTGDASWLAAVEAIVPALADAFGPTMLVSQHGCDSHVLDPLAHLRLTTVAYDRAARLLDGLAHRFTAGRWLATGGGGYDAYRVVPRSWALVWLAQAHRESPEHLPAEWGRRWAEEAGRHHQGPPPGSLLDPPGSVEAEGASVAQVNRRHAEAALSGALRHLHGGLE